MSNDQRDDGNPFAPTRRSGDQVAEDDREPAGRLPDDRLAADEDDEYRFDYRAEDFDYDPDEILDDEEEPELPAGWPDANEPGGAGTPPPAATRPDTRPQSPPTAAVLDDDNVDVDVDDDVDTSDDAWNEIDDDTESIDNERYGNLDEEDWEEDYEEEESASPLQSWPLGMIAIAVVALILLSVGGFGVMQERSAMQERVRDLEARLAVAVDPEQLATERGAHRELVLRNETLGNRVQSLLLENRRLNDTVSGLEKQLAVQRAAADNAGSGNPAKASAADSTKPKPAPSAPAVTAATSGNWFVNFGSYSQRRLAESWAGRLKPAAGEVKVIAAPGGDLYRVRVVSLPDRSTARSVASDLQKTYKLPELWVGED
ncbi:SPOR domain-containing protein [Parahaliea mediterranea]|uniref:SPOR domain-containing protein n=1 Tax=Parahaliea mediterranea TaxID=651086 RepID=A0A939DFM4_9GAMM|nr:SPOR domain-containing protein [Parahaliea mediterranea]MBN7797230.1 SPOR domain-containing protein [Parahaliea mediterranea]